MRRLSLRGVVFVALAAATAASCADTPSDPTPVPTPNEIVETFTGTVTINGGVSFRFDATQAGTVNATIKALQPGTIVTTGDGAGNFIPGETVFQGPNLEEATWTGVVHAWTPSQSALSLTSTTGSFTTDGLIQGVDSQAQRIGASSSQAIVGLALGTQALGAGTCQAVLTNDLATLGITLSGVVQGAGTLCARVYDVGKLPVPATFTIEVAHF